ELEGTDLDDGVLLGMQARRLEVNGNAHGLCAHGRLSIQPGAVLAPSGFSTKRYANVYGPPRTAGNGSLFALHTASCQRSSVCGNHAPTARCRGCPLHRV